MKKLDYVRRIGINEFNTLIEKVNEIVEKLNAKIEIEEVSISKEVKDFKFFNWEEVTLPYHSEYTIASAEDASRVFEKYTFSYKDMKAVNDLIMQWKIVSLKIDIAEEVTEKEKKQEATFETVEVVDLDKPIKTKWKRGRKKKSSWT